ncbi:McrC family protein [Granulicoccus phenolivorans]|uniref:McrC family protein n=1 Tax=Granulicoccus phenolivorans TaxID=266854 RepID=UPI000556DAA3|nr:hypothetical protein [Granulicoccus phenolivorans]
MADPLILREGDQPQLVQFSRPIADALSAANVVQLARTDRPDWWEVSAGTRIGVVSVDGLQVIIQPKLAIDRLVFLMGYARNPKFWREDRVRLDTQADLPEALAQAFERLAKRALDQGLLKGYLTIDETLPVLRGRIREADQLRHRWGRSLPLEVRYDEFTVDIPENRLLLAAVEQLLRMPWVGPRHRAGLQRLRLQLSEVTAPVRGAERPTWTASRLNARYAPALVLAELILDGHSFEQRTGDVTVSGYLFNMTTLFEDFVTVALREAMKPYGGRSVLQYRTHLDETGAVAMRPDYVWLKQGVPKVVADAKYKAEKPSGFPQADMYQLLAYCTVLQLPVGHLIYAKGNELPRAYEVRSADIRILAHTLHLDAAPQDVLASVQTLVEQLVELAGV